jgi:RND family efflux transporter MFP subunit
VLAVEQSEKALESARASANAGTITARSNVTTASGELEQARISQDDLEVLAPFDGVVVSIPERKGREIQVGELIIAVENANLLKITAFVSADQVQYLRAGDIVRIDDDAQARITSVAPSADVSTKKYKVEIYTRDEFQAGEFVKLNFTSSSDDLSDKRIFVPVTAVHVSAAETFVWGIDDTEEIMAFKIPVRIGDVSGKYIEILEGIYDGDLIVTDGGRSIEREGQVIVIYKDL